MLSQPTLIPIYTTRGDLGAFLAYPHLYSSLGEWIGWVTREREVYSVYGEYVGWLGSGPRILRKRSDSFGKSRRSNPNPAPHISPPSHVPLPGLMPELPMEIIDVLDEAPELLPTVDFGEQRLDID